MTSGWLRSAYVFEISSPSWRTLLEMRWDEIIGFPEPVGGAAGWEDRTSCIRPVKDTYSFKRWIREGLAIGSGRIPRRGRQGTDGGSQRAEPPAAVAAVPAE